jgi:hypothetical protein
MASRGEETPGEPLSDNHVFEAKSKLQRDKKSVAKRNRISRAIRRPLGHCPDGQVWLCSLELMATATLNVAVNAIPGSLGRAA